MSNLAKPAGSASATVVPYLCVKDSAAAIEFYKQAFGATEIMRLNNPAGQIGHAEISIGGALVMLADEIPAYGNVSPTTLGGCPAKLAMQVPDVDAFVARAVAAGAKLVMPVADQFYGERSGRVEDPFGYSWLVSTHIEDVTPAEMQQRYDALCRGMGQE